MDGSLVIMEGSSLLRFYFYIGWQPCHYGRQFVVQIFLLQWMVALSLCKVVCCRDFFYSNGWQHCHYGRQSVIEIFLLQWMVALSLWKVVCYRDCCYSNGWQPCHNGRQSIVEIFVIPMDDNLIIMGGSLLQRFLLLQWMVALSLWKVDCCRYFCYSNGWQPCLYVRQSVVDIFVIPMDGKLLIMEGSLFSSFCYSNGW